MKILYNLITDRALKRIQQLAAAKVSQDKIAADMGIALPTFKLWMRKYKCVRTAYEMGRCTAEKVQWRPTPEKKNLVLEYVVVRKHYTIRPDLLIWCDPIRRS